MPVAEIVNHLIEPSYRRYFALTIQREASGTFPVEGFDQQGGEETRLTRAFSNPHSIGARPDKHAQALSLDHVFVLSDRRGFTTPVFREDGQRRDRVYLLAIEEKVVDSLIV